MMKSSYKNSINYKDIFSTLCFVIKPKKIVEIGLLDGYSLKTIADNVSSNCHIKAYDIFEEFNGNSANKEILIKKFQDYSNISIEYGDFYNLHHTLDDSSIDILHIDIANNGDVYEFVFNHYISKIKTNGIIIMEGGSKQRDNIEWMNKYDKPKIKPVIDRFNNNINSNSNNNKLNIITIGDIPSITLIKL